LEIFALHARITCLYKKAHESFILPDPKGHVRYCHHFAWIVVCNTLTFITLGKGGWVGGGEGRIVLWVWTLSPYVHVYSCRLMIFILVDRCNWCWWICV